MKKLRALKLVVNCLLISTMAMTSGNVLADNFYKWVDSKGTTHYTKTPPPKNAKKTSTVETYGFTPSSNNAAETPAKAPDNAAPTAPAENTPNAPETPEVTTQPIETSEPPELDTEAM